MKMNFSNRLLMISRKNLKNMVQVMKTVVEAVRKYEYANHCKIKLRKKTHQQHEEKYYSANYC